MKILCLGTMCNICNNAKRAMRLVESESTAYNLSDEDILDIYQPVFATPQLTKCTICECVVCECTIQDNQEPKKRIQKLKKTFRSERATPKGEGHRWKAVEKTTTSWGSPADKARKREAMRVKQQRKWREAFLPEEDDIEIEKVHKIREPVRDQPCKPNFLEYTGKGWPQCGEPVMYHAPKWPKKI